MLHHDSAIRQALRKRSTLKRHVMLSTRKALVLSATVFTTGVWLSIDQNDWTWFARSGSMIVVIGIYLTSSQIIENSRRLKIRRSHHKQNFHRDYAEDIKRGTLARISHQGRDEHVEIWIYKGFYEEVE